MTQLCETSRVLNDQSSVFGIRPLIDQGCVEGSTGEEQPTWLMMREATEETKSGRLIADNEVYQLRARALKSPFSFKYIIPFSFPPPIQSQETEILYPFFASKALFKVIDIM